MVAGDRGAVARHVRLTAASWTLAPAPWRRQNRPMATRKQTAPPEPAPAVAAPPAVAALADRRLGAETMRSHARRLREGFYDRYLSGDAVLDIGYRGGKADAEPVTGKAIGVELDYPGYDGVHLPFPDGSQDAVFASHTLEHLDDWQTILADWFRVLKIGGFLVIAVPHQQLYERRAYLPSRFNGNHKRFYLPSSLMAQIEAALPLASWRLRSLRDIDEGFRYDLPPEAHPKGCYEIELVVEKIAPPAYAGKLAPSSQAQALTAFYARLVTDAVAARAAGKPRDMADIQEMLTRLPLPSFRQLEPLLLPAVRKADAMPVLRPVVQQAPFDEQDYLARYPDIKRSIDSGKLQSGHAHFIGSGYFEGRFATPVPAIFT
jgi:SAM-dependent methyltransferase